MARKDTLFLHFGPGGNAEIEKKLLTKDFPQVDFWNQPILEGNEISYELLLNAARRRLRSISNQGTVRSQIWGHSFGCNIALDLISKDSDGISQLTLTSPLAHFQKGFFNLAKKMADDSQTSVEHKKELLACIEKHKNDPSSGFWEIIGTVAKDADFGRMYWNNRDKYKKYLILAQQAALNFPMWQAVVADYLTLPHTIEVPKNIKVKIEISEFDPYVSSFQEESQYWKSKIHHAEIILLQDQGHYAHFEKYL